MLRADRRMRRSRNKQLAITWFLQSCILRLGLESLVLGDRDGLLIAVAGKGVDPESAAAFAPFVFHDAWDFPENVSEAYFVDAIPMADTTFYLFAVGRTSNKSLQSAGTKGGIRRILDEDQDALN